MFSENLKKVRTELRYTLEAMSEKLGVKNRTYVSWERENKMPPMELGKLLLEKLNVNLNWFCTGKGEMFLTQKTNLSDMDIRNIVKSSVEENINKIIDEKLKERGI